MFFHNNEYSYIKIPKSLVSNLNKAIVQSVISLKFDKRSEPGRVAMSEFILMQFLNELNNSDYLESSKIEQLDNIFEGIEEKDSDD